MVNISYDTSEQLIWFDPETKETFVYNGGDIAWTLTSTALVWMMIPGLGFYYGGSLRRKNSLSMIYLSVGTIAIVSFQWFLWGFSLAFSDTASRFIGDLRYVGLKGVLAQPSIGSSRVPSIVFCVYQLMFAAITPMIAVGAIAERGRLGPALVFIFIWSTLVYDPIACWTWNRNGWSKYLGVFDFAGGTPVHISSGSAALAISMYLPNRPGFPNHFSPPHNTTYVILGTVFLWFGWFGFNGGSALSANLRAAQACIVTNLAASVGGVTWMLWDYILRRKTWSAAAFCSGAISGLVAITPGAGFVGAPASVAFGVAAGTCCKFATWIKFIRMFEYDDALDIFAAHAIGGLVGNILTGVFAQSSVAEFDGKTQIKGGWLDLNWVQLGIQLANSVAGMSYSFVVTTLILWFMHFFPYLRLSYAGNNATDPEIIGVDRTEMGEFAYDDVDILGELERHGRILERLERWRKETGGVTSSSGSPQEENDQMAGEQRGSAAAHHSSIPLRSM